MHDMLLILGAILFPSQVLFLDKIKNVTREERKQYNWKEDVISSLKKG